MREQEDLTEDFEQEINNSFRAARLDEIKKRKCSSNKHDGIEYKFYGGYVPIRPIINVVKEKHNLAIENMSFVNEYSEKDLNHKEATLIVFVADLRQEQPHPAFTEESF